jgi:hypothetical protein
LIVRNGTTEDETDVEWFGGGFAQRWDVQVRLLRYEYHGDEVI